MQNRLSADGYAAFDVVVVGASLGGPAALIRLLEAIPPTFPADVLVAQHLATSSGWLRGRLAEHSVLPVQDAVGGESLRGGRVYLSPPDSHLLVTARGTLALSHSPKVKFCRPAAEPLFASAAATYRERTLGVVLTGCNTDGAIGTQMIKWMGGRVLAQDPDTAVAPGMPKAAIATGAVDFVLPIDRIAAALVALVMVRGVADYLKVWPAAA